jgi:hypothetical protein
MIIIIIIKLNLNKKNKINNRLVKNKYEKNLRQVAKFEIKVISNCLQNDYYCYYYLLIHHLDSCIVDYSVGPSYLVVDYRLST